MRDAVGTWGSMEERKLSLAPGGGKFGQRDARGINVTALLHVVSQPLSWYNESRGASNA